MAETGVHTEEDALALVRQMQEQFGWGVVVMTREDAEQRAEAALSEEQWATVRATHSWRRGWTNDALMEDAWYVVDSALEEAKIV